MRRTASNKTGWGEGRDLKFPKDESISKKKYKSLFYMNTFLKIIRNTYLYGSKKRKEVGSSVQGSLWSSNQGTGSILSILFFCTSFSCHFASLKDLCSRLVAVRAVWFIDQQQSCQFSPGMHSYTVIIVKIIMSSSLLKLSLSYTHVHTQFHQKQPLQLSLPTSTLGMCLSIRVCHSILNFLLRSHSYFRGIHNKERI